MRAGTARKTVPLLYLLLVTLFQCLVCGTNGRVATGSIDSLPSPTQTFTLLPLATRHAGQKMYQAHSCAKVKRTCRPGNEAIVSRDMSARNRWHDQAPVALSVAIFATGWLTTTQPKSCPIHYSGATSWVCNLKAITCCMHVPV